MMVEEEENVSCLSKFSLKQIDFKLSIELSSGRLPLSEIISFEEICRAKYSEKENGFKYKILLVCFEILSSKYFLLLG